jgi:thiamine-phosphate pyrophosphorylase
VRPLPRLFAVTDSSLCARDDFGIRVAAIASAGSAVAVVVRAPEAPAARQLGFLDRAGALVRPAEAALFGHGDPALARMAHAAGVQLRRSDLAPRDARRVLGDGWIGVSVGGRDDAAAAFAEGADYVVAGSVFETSSHPGRAARGLDWLADVVALGRPVVAIGGITAERAALARAAGAWGVAAISALFGAAEPARAAARILEAMEP